MPRVPECDRGEAHLPAFADADLDGLRGHALAEAVMTIDYGQRRSVDHDLDFPIGEKVAFAQPFEVARDAHDAVAVMPGEVGRNQRLAKPLAFRARAAGLDEDVADEVSQGLRPQGNHSCPLQ